MPKAFLVTGNALYEPVWRVVLSLPQSQLDWVYETFLGMLDNATRAQAWVTGGETTPTEAAAIFEQIYDGIKMLPPMIGFIFDYPAETPPINCLVCDGVEYDRVDYPDLYEVLDPAFRTGADTFITPDLRNRYRRGTEFADDIGDVFGSDTSTIAEHNLPSHAHSIDGYIPGVALTPGELPVFTTASVPSITGFTGSNDPIDVIPKSMVLLPCIVALYP